MKVIYYDSDTSFYTDLVDQRMIQKTNLLHHIIITFKMLNLYVSDTKELLEYSHLLKDTFILMTNLTVYITVRALLSSLV